MRDEEEQNEFLRQRILNVEGEFVEIIDAAVREAEFWRAGYMRKDRQVQALYAGGAVNDENMDNLISPPRVSEVTEGLNPSIEK